MTHLLLRPHPDFPCGALARIEAKVEHSSADRLDLSFMAIGQIGEIRLSPPTTASRSDGLWQSTCFEAFIRPASAPDYYEFNFAPSTQWAAYRFNSYRSGMSLATEIDATSIETRLSPSTYRLKASVPIDRLFALSPNTSWRLGLSALIEDRAGHMSYWALAHPSGKPDFHHSDCFAYEFSPAISE